MNSISQNFVNVAKNVTKKSFNFACNIYLWPSLSNLFNDASDNAYVSYSLKIKEAFNKTIIETLKLAIPAIDKHYCDSEYRKSNFYKSNSHSRTIVTIFGELNFERNYYTDKNKKNGFYLIDELFHFEKFTTYDCIFRAIMIDNSVNINANNTSIKSDYFSGNFSDYLSESNFCKIPRQSIYNWINNWNIPKVEYDYIENVKNLYVMVDEKWIHEQIRLSTLSEEERNKRHYIMSKCFVTFTGAKTKNNRSELLNKHIHITSSDKPWDDFMDSIYNIYNFEEIENIYLLSDAGTWILAGKANLKLFSNNKIIVNTCEFHVKNYINRLTRAKEKRALLSKIIYEEKDKNKFTEYADEIINDAKNKTKKTQYKNYILNHWKTILNMKDRVIKSSMESHISHCIANHFGSRPKGFSKKRIEKYLKLEEYKQNGVNIMKLYLDSYNKTPEDNYVYQKENVSFSIFEKNTSILPAIASNNPISILLNKIAHSR